MNTISSDTIAFVRECIESSERGLSRMDDSDLDIVGMSGLKVRSLINNICSRSFTKYLEIGLWKGSTFFSALKGNEISAVGIDNWSEFGGPREEFERELSRYSGRNTVRVQNSDCFVVDPRMFGEVFNVYLYDGPHDVESHRKAFTHYDRVLADTFISIVDDWRQPEVREGTRLAFRELNYEVLFSQELEGSTSGDGDPMGWWNGLLVSVLKKQKKNQDTDDW